MQKQPNRFLAPIVIAGITVGFLASAYKFIFKKPKVENPSDLAAQPERSDSSQQPDVLEKY